MFTRARIILVEYILVSYSTRTTYSRGTRTVECCAHTHHAIYKMDYVVLCSAQCSKANRGLTIVTQTRISYRDDHSLAAP